jgi:hypothetical protein
MSISELKQIGLEAVRTMFQNGRDNVSPIFAEEERVFLRHQLLENAKKSHSFANGHMIASIKGSEITIMPTTDFAAQFLEFQCEQHPGLFEQNEDGSVTVSVENPGDQWDFLSAFEKNYASRLKSFLSSATQQGLG